MPYVTHPSFKELKSDTLVQRFMPLQKFLAMLTSSSLYFARASEFDDPKEGLFPDVMMNNIKNNNEDQSIGSMWDQLRKNAQFTTYVNCWNLGEVEQSYMWDKYAGHGGVAITSTYERLCNSFQKTSDPVFIGQVTYGDDHLISRKTIGNDFDYWLRKEKTFIVDNEVRCVISHPFIQAGAGVVVKKAGQPHRAISWPVLNGTETPKGIEVAINLGILIDSIVLAPPSEDWMVPVIRRLIEKYDLRCSVLQAKS